MEQIEEYRSLSSLAIFWALSMIPPGYQYGLGKSCRLADRPGLELL
jgi:hypothetical protein